MDLHSWADVAAILLILELFIMVLPWLILFYFAVRGLRALHRKLAGEWFPLVRTSVTRVETTTKQVSGAMVQPAIRVISTAHGIRAGARSLVGDSGPSMSM